MPLPLHHSRHPSSSDLSSQSGYPSHLCVESDSTIRCSKIYLDQLCNGETKRLLITSSTGMHSDFGGPEAKTIVVFSSEWSASMTFWEMAQDGYSSRKLYTCLWSILEGCFRTKKWHSCLLWCSHRRSWPPSCPPPRSPPMHLASHPPICSSPSDSAQFPICWKLPCSNPKWFRIQDKVSFISEGIYFTHFPSRAPMANIDNIRTRSMARYQAQTVSLWGQSRRILH